MANTTTSDAEWRRGFVRVDPDRLARAAKKSHEGKELRRQNGTDWKGHPATAEMDYSDDEREFLMAIQDFRTANRKPFPTWVEAMRVLINLGYTRTGQAGE